MPDITQLLQFEDAEIRIHDLNGDRWVTVKELAEALGYTEDDTLIRLIARNPEEFKGKTCKVKMTSQGQVREVTVLNYRGVIRAAMKSDAPRAIKFRDWAEEVLFQVMMTGAYVAAGWRGVPGPRMRWHEALTPSEHLRLAELRVSIWMGLADNPTSSALWQALYATFGGPSGYVEYLQRVNRGGGRSVNLEDLPALRNLDPVATPEERGF